METFAAEYSHQSWHGNFGRAFDFREHGEISDALSSTSCTTGLGVPRGVDDTLFFDGSCRVSSLRLWKR